MAAGVFGRIYLLRDLTRCYLLRARLGGLAGVLGQNKTKTDNPGDGEGRSFRHRAIDLSEI